jgi:DNA invertase Pin-like site-specific DNA recombinase
MSKLRRPVVWVRKSTDAQEEEAQRNNVAKMLEHRSIIIPQERWFAATVSRAAVASDPEHKRLLQLVEAGDVDVIYIESESRWGSIETAEAFQRIEHLKSHGVKLFALTEDRELTARGFENEIRNFLGAHASKTKLVGEADQGLRSRISNLQQRKSWPSGAAPYGYGKECLSDGKRLWVFEQSQRTKGTTRYVSGSGKLSKPSPEGKIPRKAKGDVIRLVPSEDKQKIDNVRTIFKLYVNEGLSRRAIAVRMNSIGRRYYDKPFTPSIIDGVLVNPAYIGEVHFGKQATGKYRTVGEGGLTTEAEESYRGGQRVALKRTRPVAERVVATDAHKPLIDKKLWKAAQKRIDKEKALNGANYSSRNPNYWLKGLLYCGHCGKPLVGRTDKDVVGYICTSFVTNHQTGLEGKCGFYRIRHDDAERLLLDTLTDHGIEWEELARRDLPKADDQLRVVRGQASDASKALDRIIEEGVQAFVSYADGAYADLSKKERRSAASFFESGAEGLSNRDYRTLGSAIHRAEQAAAKAAQENLTKVEARHKKVTLALLDASPAQAVIFKEECRQLESQMADLRAASVPVSIRLEAAYERIDEIAASIVRIKREIERAPDRAKGELFKSVIDKATLYWTRQHVSPSAKPTRPRTTDRNGRYRYALDTSRITVDFVSSDPQGSW